MSQEVLHMRGIGAVPDHPGRAAAPKHMRRHGLRDPRCAAPPEDDLRSPGARSRSWRGRERRHLLGAPRARGAHGRRTSRRPPRPLSPGAPSGPSRLSRGVPGGDPLRDPRLKARDPPPPAAGCRWSTGLPGPSGPERGSGYREVPRSGVGGFRRGRAFPAGGDAALSHTGEIPEAASGALPCLPIYRGAQ